MANKTTKIDEVVNASVEANASTIDTNEPLAYLVKKEDGYHIEDLDGNIGEVLKSDKNDALILTENAANRKWVMCKKADAFFAENGDDAKFPLMYKATRTMDGASRSTKLPNEKLISYLPEAEQEEYKAIIARAIQARDAERAASKAPKSEADKARAKIAKLVAQLKDMGVSDEEIDALLAGKTNEGGNE